MKELWHTIWKRENRKKRIIVYMILLVVVLFFVYKNFGQNTTPVEDDVTYETIGRRTIVSSVSGTGTVVSANNEEVTTDLFGLKVSAVNVAEGDTVEAGTVIATLDTSALEDQKSTLQDQINSLRSAQTDYHTAYTSNQATAEETRQSQITSTSERLETAKNDLTAAQEDLANTQTEYDTLAADETATAADLYALELVLETKKTNVSTIQTRVDTLQDTLDALNANGSTGTSDAALAEYDASVDSSVTTIQSQINDIQEQINRGTVTCSMAGTVTAVNVSPGDTYTGSTIATIEGVDTFMVEAYVDEYDISDITTGMAVYMKTDATRDEELQGTVTYIAPKASTGSSDSLSSYSSLFSGVDLSSISGSSSSSASYLVRISLDTPNDRLRLGMNAKISIVLSESQDVLAVPIESIQEDEEGGRYIIVKDEEATEASEDGAVVTKEIPVTTGIEGTYYIEVTGDVEEGMEVQIPSSSGEESVDDLINMMGSAGGV